MSSYVIELMGHAPPPPDLTEATDANVEDVLRRVVETMGWPASEVEIERASSTVGCIATIDIVASVRGTPMAVARPALFR